MSMAIHEALSRAQADLGKLANKDELTPDEARRFDELGEQIEELKLAAARQNREAADVVDDIARRAAKAPTAPSARSTSEDPGDYHAGPDSPSFVRDMIAWRAGTADAETRGRIERHANWATETRSLSTTDSAGGYLVAPAYLQSDFINLRVQAAPILQHITRLPLPEKTDQVNIPKQTGGVEVSYTTENSALPETDAVFSTVQASVFRLGGLQKASNFVMDRSLPGLDGIIMRDLGAQLWKKVGQEVINGAGPVGAFEGILQADSIGTATFTSGTPTLAELWPVLLNAVSDVSASHYSTQGIVIVMHPRRFAWVLAQLDDNNRPFIESYGGTGQNIAGTSAGGLNEGIAGNLLGMPVVLDNGIPTTLGAGTNEDRIIVGNLKDACALVEASPKFAVDFSEGFSTDSARMRVTYDAAFSPELYPGAISVVSGTGLSATI